MENSFNNISDDLELWASDDDIAGHGGRQRHIATSSGVTLAGHQTHAKIAHLKNQRRRGNRQVGVGASGSVQGNAAPRTGHRSAATRPKRITEALERDATIQISTGKPASSSTFAIRTTQSRQSGDTNVVPATDSLATNSLNAEIRGLFERAARVSLSKQATDSTAGTHPEDSQEMHAEEEEELLKTQARHLEEEMSRLREQHFSLAMRSEEMRVRKAASKTLEAFEAKLQNERAGMIQSLKDERNEKMRAAAAFQREIEMRINELEGVLSQLGSKAEGVTASYDATVEEVQREFSEALLHRKQLLEMDIEKQLAAHFSILQHSKKEMGLTATHLI